jgi:hypothetical protein
MFSCVSLWVQIFLLNLEVGRLSHAVRIEAVVSYETLVTCCDTALYTGEDSDLHTYHCDNRKFQNLRVLRVITYSIGPEIG